MYATVEDAVSELGRILFRNTATNYVILAWRMVTAIIVTRALFLGLGEENYGFWSLLWAVFGYSILLDFGFGQSVQKYTAEESSNGDMARFNRIIATVVGGYCLMSLLIVVATLALTPFINHLFTMRELGDLAYYKKAFLVFGIGTALVFPTGVFPEILVGLNRQDLRNYVLFANITLNLAGICLILWLGDSVVALAVFVTLLNLLTNLAMAVMVCRLLPDFRLSPRLFKLRNVREIAEFSAFSYVITLARMVAFRTDRIVLGAMLGMGSVAVYQVGTRVPELMESLTTRFQENLAPIAAALHKTREDERLKSVLLNSSRFSAFLGTGAFVIFYFLAAPILHVWLNVTSGPAFAIAHITIVSVLVVVLFRSVPEQFLLMAGKHRLLAAVVVAESVLNLVLSVLLVWRIGVTGIVWGTLIPNALLSALVVFPATARLAGIGLWEYSRKVLFPMALLGAPPALLLAAAVHRIPLHDWNLLMIAVAATIAGALYLALSLLFFLNEYEKRKILEMLPETIRRRFPRD